MVSVRVVRSGIEVAASAPPILAAHKQSIDFAFVPDVAGVRVRVVRMGVEVAAEVPPVLGVYKQSIDFAFAPSSVAGVAVRVVYMGIEVAGPTAPVLGVYKQSVDFSFAPNVTGIGVRVVRQSFEFAAKSPATVIPSAFPSNFDLFLHNWATRLVMEAAYSTDISSAVASVSEERRALLNKPYRQLSMVWTIEGVEESDLFYRQLRALTREPSAIPLYQEQTPLLEDTLSTDNIIFVDTTDRRFFKGMHIICAKVDEGDYEFEGTWFHRKIDNRFANRLELDSDVGVDMKAGQWLVFPVMNTDIKLDPEYTQITDRIAEIKLVLDESIGAMTLPPVQTGNPDGYSLYKGAPVWNVKPNWKDGISVQFLREGEQYFVGKGRSTYLRGTRHRVLHNYGLVFDNRHDFYMFLRLFDTCRGRARSFWQVDQETIWTVNSIDATGNFVDFDPLGDFTEFQRELGQADGGHLGLVYEDGTILVREVANITVLGGNWRVTLATPFPTNLSTAGLERASRARLVRFFEDSMKEEWVTADICIVSVKTIEVLVEQTEQL